MALVIAFGLIVSGCHSAGSTATTVSKQVSSSVTLQQQLDEFLQGLLSNSDSPSLRSAILYLNAPAQDFSYAGATGTLRENTNEPIRSNDLFYIASITKTMTAVRVLQMVEEGWFTLDTRLKDLGVFDAAVLERLHIFSGVSYGADITIRQLLSHRSGMRDYLLDDRTGLGSDYESGLAPGSMGGIWLSQLGQYLACRRGESKCDSHATSQSYPARPWSHWNAQAFQDNPNNKDAGLLNFYLAEMGNAALFAPGEGVHYSDTNFMLLGVIIEQLTNSNLATQFEKALFRPLGMKNSFLSDSQTLSNIDDMRLADFYLGDVAIVSQKVDVSWDWGGGGVVSTAQELAIFMRAVVSGDLFSRPETLNEMLNFQPVIFSEGIAIVQYGLGIRNAKTEFGPSWGHKGAWGAHMAYFPDLDLVVTGTVNAYGTGKEKLLIEGAVRIFVDSSINR